jgi:hypothetical protein
MTPFLASTRSPRSITLVCTRIRFSRATHDQVLGRVVLASAETPAAAEADVVDDAEMAPVVESAAPAATEVRIPASAPLSSAMSTTGDGDADGAGSSPPVCSSDTKSILKSLLKFLLNVMQMPVFATTIRSVS